MGDSVMKRRSIFFMSIMFLGMCVIFAAQAAAQITIDVIYHDTGSQFSQVIKQGAMDAGKELGIKVEYLGPIGIKVDEEVATVEDAIAKHVSGIAVSNVNGDALNPVIDQAIAAGIPVVTFNSEAPGSKRMGFFGQNLVQSGREAGEIIEEYMGPTGKMLIITGEAGASWSQDREKGVRESIAKFPGITIVNTISTGWEEQAQYAAIENALRANPDITGIVTLDAATTPATGRAIIRLHKIGAIKQVGFDLIPETLDNIKAGATNASLSQNPYMQGYLPVKALYDYIVNKKPIKGVDTGILRVDEKNIDKYIQKLNNGEPIG
jgi:simple sugar transport system substrate-binding protein/ribose transport system substrate-binding protein